MPAKNVDRVDIEKSYYHVYTHGVGRQPIFKSGEDYDFFLSLFERHLSLEQSSDKLGRKYKHLRGQVEIIGYCLIDNYLHLLFYQDDKGAIARLMHAIMTSYSIYFNKKYHRSGPLFESRYRAAIILSDLDLGQISRYIHLASGDWQAYLYSSIHAYFGIGLSDWLQPDRLINLFGTTPVYADYLDDKADYKQSLANIKPKLANVIK
ncbi:MAG: transposase [Candidatus Saccharibacteria bacterium]